MQMRQLWTAGFCAAMMMFALLGPAAAATYVTESARQLPVAYDVDVVVIGGSTGAVSAACEAAASGAKVFLAAPRPYLGEDVTGTLRLWLNEGEEPTGDLEKALFVVPRQEKQGIEGSVPFTYKTDVKPAAAHGETPKHDRLTDGKWLNSAKDSVQFDGPVTIEADLGSSRKIRSIHLLAYQRPNDFEVGEIKVWSSATGEIWREVGTMANKHLSEGVFEENSFAIDMDVFHKARYMKVTVTPSKGAKRILLGELVIAEDAPAGAVEAPKKKEALPLPTPMHVKQALDTALISSGVTFLYGCMPTDVLVDADGNPAGIVMVNRSGRQVVRAKVIIDATPHATVARLAGAKLRDFTPGPMRFTRVIVHPEVKPDDAKLPDNVTRRDIGERFNTKQGPMPVYEYTLNIDMKADDIVSFEKAEQVARDLTFRVDESDASDTLYFLPTNPLISNAGAPAANFDAASLDLASLQPKGSSRFFVLDGYADVSREAAAQLMRPLSLIRLGKRVGHTAAELAAKAPTADAQKIKLVTIDAPSDNMGEVGEFLNGVRPTDRDKTTLPSPARALPVLGEYDVVVVGGGTGGAPAGIGAARQGARTLVVEYQDGLGGVGTLGMVSIYYHGYRHGFTSEVDAGVQAMGGPKFNGWNIEAKTEWWRREIRKAGGDVWFSTLGCGALVKDGVVKGVIVTTPMGRGVVLTGCVVDSTGNTDIAAAAGAQTMTVDADNIAMQGTGLGPVNLGAGYTNTDYSFSDESDPVDQWRMIVNARRKFAGAYDLSPFIDSRERRRIVGDFYITPLDLINQRTYPDTIAIHKSNFDTHGYTVHPFFLIDFPDKKEMEANVPYRALLPKGLDRILVTGLGISAHRDAMPILRMQACIQNQGYAAGCAAAMSAKYDKATRDIDLEALQKHLVAIGSLPQEVIGAKDSYPISDKRIAEAVKTVTDDYKGLALLMAEPAKAIPMLREAHAKTDDPAKKLVYANVLGMLGDAAGAATLAAHVQSAKWDEGWNFRGMGQFGGSISPLDSQIIALGRSGDHSTALPVLIAKARSLEPSMAFSHYRAVAMALEALKDPAAAPVLAEMLSKPGMTGFSIHEVKADSEYTRQEMRSEPLREIILARALYRCGDQDGIARKILESYATDLRGLFAKHANAVLSEKQ